MVYITCLDKQLSLCHYNLLLQGWYHVTLNWRTFSRTDMFSHIWLFSRINCSVFCPSGIDYSSPWRESFNAARESIRQNLHILHPSMQTILGICQSKNYSTMLITDQSNLRLVILFVLCVSISTCYEELNILSVDFHHLGHPSALCCAHFYSSLW